MNIKMILKSDMCPGSGESTAGYIDNDISFDKYGIPYIHSKRLKGCLKEIACDINLIDSKDMPEEKISEMFGKTGEKEGKIFIDNGYIENYEQEFEIMKDLEDACNKENQIIFESCGNLKDYYTSLRNQTKVNSDGVSEKNTLRTTRAIKKGFSFLFKVEGGEAFEKELELCCKLLRNFGLSRTRGLGEVECILEKSSINNSNETNQDLQKKTSSIIKYCLKTDSPVITGKNYIPGSMILGSIASIYKKKGKSDAGEEFKNLFLQEKVKFSNAYPSCGDESSFPIPLCLYSKKGESDDKLYNFSDFEKYKKLFEKDSKYVNGINGFISKVEGEDDNDKYYILKVNEEINYHHTRPEDKNIGHATAEGNFFYYNAIGKDQEFIGYIDGEDEYLNIIFQIIKEEKILHIGKSRSSQYGCCSIKNIEFLQADKNISINCGSSNYAILTLVSPMVVINKKGFNTNSSEDIIKEVFAGDEDFINAKKHFFIKTSEYRSFNSKWNFPKDTYVSFLEGSTIVFEKNNIDLKKMKNVHNKSFGCFINEGYGKVAFNLISTEDIRLEQKTNITKDGTKNIDSLLKEIKEIKMKKYFLIKIFEKIIDKALSEIKANDYISEIVKYFKDENQKSTLENFKILIINSEKFDDISDFIKRAKNKRKIETLFFEKSEEEENKSYKIRYENVISELLKSNLEDDAVSFFIELFKDESICFEIFKSMSIKIIETVKYEHGKDKRDNKDKLVNS